MKAWETFYKNVTCRGLVKEGGAVLLAVSGGKDSMAMLHMFWRLSKKISLSLYVAHFNHGLRKEAKRDAAVVKKFSDALKIPCKTIALDVKKYAALYGLSIENAGRDLRYENLFKLSKKLKCGKIATAHNSNDNAETVLMQLLRGSGNLTGIPLIRKADGKIEIIRPLLNIKRKDIEAYINEQKLYGQKLHGQKLPFCTDKSNFSLEYTRNRVRLKVIPTIEKINPQALAHIFSLSEIQTREDAFLEETALKYLKKCSKSRKNRILLDLSMFLRYNDTVRFIILKKLLPDRKYAPKINLIMDAIKSKNDFAYKISAKWFFKIKNKKAIFIKAGERQIKDSG
ncbi:MAG: tRNA lysidine(34) synthetase TilS [Endomicrobium sp.]|jgi:tRNA(Ile)-lysidine synthase|nr:tRNA lysidine(34) synthetase TilS [Endomicrobium sp.]